MSLTVTQTSTRSFPAFVQSGAKYPTPAVCPAVIPSPSCGGSPEDQVSISAISSGLADRLHVDVQSVQLKSFDKKAGFNPGDCGFPVSGELAMSAWTQGLQARFTVGQENFVYRGTDATSGRIGLDLEHKGYWKQDARQIFIPDTSAPSLEEW